MNISENFKIKFLAIVVALNGLLLLDSSLKINIHSINHLVISRLYFSLPILIGISLVYLSIQLLRAKKTAWFTSITFYLIYLVISLHNLILHRLIHENLPIFWIKSIFIPALIISLLIIWRQNYRVKSDITGIKISLIMSFTVIFVTLIYDISGFLLMDKSAFHRQLSFFNAFHYTVDQFNLTTNTPLIAYTQRAKLFLDSLSIISLTSLIYVILALFQPLKSRLSDQSSKRQEMITLLNNYPSESEDFFKLWPYDKHYFLNADKSAGLAYKVSHGIALVLGEPSGRPESFQKLIKDFKDVCYINDWSISFIHIKNNYHKIFTDLDFKLQKIGQEALVDLSHFSNNVKTNKYFRNIINKFEKQGFSSEILSPPFHPAILKRLKNISDEWLLIPGRNERGFAMGYFDEKYMNMCQIYVVRDAANTIQAFLNMVPADFDYKEATYDLLRHSKENISNINDYLLIGFCDYLLNKNYLTLNMGLCPLVGLKTDTRVDKGLITNVLNFAYSNGNRIYSFSGLYRFKVKYEPIWRDRYIAYQGNVGSFIKTMNALVRVMKVK